MKDLHPILPTLQQPSSDTETSIILPSPSCHGPLIYFSNYSDFEWILGAVLTSFSYRIFQTKKQFTVIIFIVFVLLETTGLYWKVHIVILLLTAAFKATKWSQPAWNMRESGKRQHFPNWDLWCFGSQLDLNLLRIAEPTRRRDSCTDFTTYYFAFESHGCCSCVTGIQINSPTFRRLLDSRVLRALYR
jgi:hypothetical protein